MLSYNFSPFPSSLCAVATLLFASPSAFPQTDSGASSFEQITVSSELRTSKPCFVGMADIVAGCEEESVVLNTYSPKPSAMLPPEIPSIVNTSTSAETEARPKDGVGVVKTEIKVVATQAESSEGFERKITPKEIETSAGTFGDPSRFMQMLPGIVSDNDKFNDFIVRGGNSQETLFIVDNIEMPSINQLALSNTTGGFVSMIDNKAIQQMTLHTDTYDSKYDQRLSAVVEISTTKDERTVPHAEVELGMAGAGGSIGRPWGTDGSVFLSGRQSILHLLTNDIGMNGVPIYNNSLFRADKRIDDRNKLWGLSVTGVDSISIHPNPNE